TNSYLLRFHASPPHIGADDPIQIIHVCSLPLLPAETAAGSFSAASGTARYPESDGVCRCPVPSAARSTIRHHSQPELRGRPRTDQLSLLGLPRSMYSVHTYVHTYIMCMMTLTVLPPLAFGVRLVNEGSLSAAGALFGQA